MHSRLRHSSVFSPAEVDITEPDVTPRTADTVRDDREHEKEEGKRTRCSYPPQTLLRRSNRDDPDGQHA